MDLTGALMAAFAVFAAGVAALPGRHAEGRFGAWHRQRVRIRAAQLERARLGVSPALFHSATLVAPPLALALLWSFSPVVAAAGCVATLLAPRLLLSTLGARRQARSEREAPHLLELLIANLGAGATYFDALQAARAGTRDRQLAEDLDLVVRRFLLDVPLESALLTVRRRIAGRNLGLVWDNLAICVAQKIPTDRARDLLLDLSTTVRYNAQLSGEVHAQTSGQRVQIWIMALLVPAIYLYLRAVSPYFLSVLDETWTGRWLLLPGAAALEVLGIWLSFRLSRVTV